MKQTQITKYNDYMHLISIWLKRNTTIKQSRVDQLSK